MWIDNIKELKKKIGMSSKQIADKTGLPERSVKRIFSGDTTNPYVDTIHRIAIALGSSLDEIFADTNAVVGTERLAALQENIEILKTDKDLLIADNNLLKSQVATLTARLELAETKLMYSEKLLAVYEHYNKLKTE